MNKLELRLLGVALAAMGIAPVFAKSSVTCWAPPEPTQWNGLAPLEYDRDVESCRIVAYEGFLEPFGYTYNWQEKSPLDLQYLANEGWRIEFVDRLMAGEKTEVAEVFNSALNHYFLALPDELRAIERGEAGPGWLRTGHGFIARKYISAPAVISAVVARFYGSVTPGPNSHFFTSVPQEWFSLQELAMVTPPSEPRWNYEGPAFNAFATDASGSCTGGRVPVWRIFNGGRAPGIEPNHRFSVERTVVDDMVSRGWIEEGTAFCVDPGL